MIKNDTIQIHLAQLYTKHGMNIQINGISADEMEKKCERLQLHKNVWYTLARIIDSIINKHECMW